MKFSTLTALLATVTAVKVDHLDLAQIAATEEPTTRAEALS